MTLTAVETQTCLTCAGQKEEVAVLHLSGGKIPVGTTLTARLSAAGSPQWGDYGYLLTLQDIGPGFLVFSAEGPLP